MSTITDTAKEASTRIADGAKFAGERIADGAKVASDAVSDTAKVAGKRVATGYSTAMDFVLTGMKLLPTLGTALGYFGLQRKRSNVLGNTLSFGAGLAVGAGAGLLFAPKSGADTRAALRNYFNGTKLEDMADRAVDKAETVAKNVGEKVEAAKNEVKAHNGSRSVS